MPMEAIVLAGGKAERLGDAAEGRPKALVPVAGRPLAEYQVAQLVAAGVTRVIVSCAAEQGAAFAEALEGLGAEIVLAEEPERLGRGGGLRFAARQREETGPLYAFNGDELLDGDRRGGPARLAPRRRRPRRRPRDRLPRGPAPPVLGQHRLLRARRRGHRAAAGAW